MSAVPPDFVGPILQSHLAQRQVSNIRNTERAQQVHAERQQTAAIDEKDTTVETTNGDTAVHTDAEGQGSQGRAFTTPESPDQAQDASCPPDGDEGRNIDFQA